MDSDEEQAKVDMNRRAVRFGSVTGHIAGILLFILPLLWTNATLRIADYSPRFMYVMYLVAFFATLLILPGYTSWISYHRNGRWGSVPLSRLAFGIVPLLRLALWCFVAMNVNDLLHRNDGTHREYTILEEFLFGTLGLFAIMGTVGWFSWLISTILVHSVGEWIVIRQTIKRQSKNDDSHKAI